MRDNGESAPPETAFDGAFEGIEARLYGEIFRSLSEAKLETEQAVRDLRYFSPEEKLEFFKDITTFASGRQQTPAENTKIIKYNGTEEHVKSHPYIREMVQNLKKDVKTVYEQLVEKLNKSICDIIDTRVRSPLSKLQCFDLVLYPEFNPKLRETSCYTYMNVRGMPQTSNVPDKEQVPIYEEEDTYSYAPSISKANDVQASVTNNTGSAAGENTSTAATREKPRN